VTVEYVFSTKTSFSEMCIWHIHSSIILFQTNVVVVLRAGTAVIEMPAVIHRVVAEWLASKFETLRTKNLVTQILENGYEEE
jgi:hypothetical protein